jgi:UDP-3-O-[3-hydroxymyristoyl] N-acetylglucosamine deacetylase
LSAWLGRDGQAERIVQRLMHQQHSIATAISVVGVGLHSGKRVDLCLKPAPVDAGIVYRRVDLQPAVDIPARATSVGDTRLASTLEGAAGASVQTVEHLMSACYGLGVDNLLVEVNAAELPILDGSAAAFVFLLESAGVQKQAKPRQYIRVLRTVEVREGLGKSLKWARLSPHRLGFKLAFEIAFDHPVVQASGQRAEYTIENGAYGQDVARARTFCFTRDVEAMRSTGLALGGGLDNAIVMGDYSVLNGGDLRYGDEFAKHKLLDAIGDLYLAGHPILGSYEAFRSGHGMNNQLLRALFADPENYELSFLR